MEIIKVLVVDDHYLVRRGVMDTVSEHEGLEVVGDASDGEEAVQKVRELSPDVIIMDLQMPGMGGVEATRQLQADGAGQRIIVLTVSEKEGDLFAALGAGASGYLLKSARSEELIRAVRHVADGGVLVSPVMASTLLNQLTAISTGPGFGIDTEFSPRETEVLQLLADGSTNKEIGASLFISENTVKTHLRNIMDKLHLAKRSQAAAYAIKSGFSRPGETPARGE